MFQVATVVGQGNLDSVPPPPPPQVSVADLEGPGPPAPKGDRVPGHPEWHVLRSRALRCQGPVRLRGRPPALSYRACFWTRPGRLGWAPQGLCRAART